MSLHSIPFEPNESFAKRLDSLNDPLRRLRGEFRLPRRTDGTPLVYLCGHSLGPQPLAAWDLVEQELSDWARRSRVGAFLSNSYDRARKLRLLLRRGVLPGNANSGLLARWKQVATAGMPILLLKAPGIKAQGAKPRVGEFDYIAYVVKLAGRKNRVSVDFVDSADHSFANRAGRAAVERLIAGWLAAQFPLPNFSPGTKDVSLLRTGKNQSESRKLQEAPAGLGCALEGR